MDLIRENQGCSIDDLMSHLDVSKSTIYRYITTLQSHGYVVKEDGNFHIGLRFMEMSRYARMRKSMYTIAEGLVKSLAGQTGDRATFITEENGLGVVISTEIGKHGIYADSQVGQRFYLHATSVGKALLANLSLEEVDEIIDQHGLVELTNNTITDHSTLMEELDEIREQGFATNQAERIPGVNAVATTVDDKGGNVAGAFGISAPSRRLNTERVNDEIVELLLEISEEFELRNEYSEVPRSPR
ncbi:ArcR family transcription regulator [Natrinema versiforme JCM 10478]|uniref:ArcR family transcription regulator n=2 Tax=Natrinema versiforme TaxID=88724 RepID=L9XMP0_9EURY|nr:ArcR family transcription regulator [Natrinema versiforme JCM 10478]